MNETMTTTLMPTRKKGVLTQWLEALSRYHLVKTTLYGHEADMFRLLDANRESLEIMHQQAPEMLVKYPELITNIKYQDEFILRLSRVFLSKRDYLYLTNPQERIKSSNNLPYVRDWPVDVEKQVRHHEMEEYRQRLAEENSQREKHLQPQAPERVKRTMVIYDYYQNELISKVNELSDHLDRCSIGSEQHKKLSSAMEQMQVLLKSWNVIHDLIIAPDASVFQTRNCQ